MTIVIAIGTVLGAVASAACAWVGIRSHYKALSHDERLALIHIIKARIAWEYDASPRQVTNPHFMYRITDNGRIEVKLRDRDAILVVDASMVRQAAHSANQASRQQQRAFAPNASSHHKVPNWVLALMPDEDAQRYCQEWGAHLHQLVEEGEIRQARRDRRRLALAAVTLAIALRWRRALGR
ncbi:MAG: hypothetical protein ACLQBY_17960 [Solirubrobacteraceae bacterium]